MNPSMPLPRPDPLLRQGPPLGEPVGDYFEFLVRCVALNQAIEGYVCTPDVIAEARRLLRDQPE
jgi:hypothetical protein